MIMLVTLEQASEHLRRDTSDDDTDLTLKIMGASQAILNYLKDPLLAYEYARNQYGQYILDSDGNRELAMDSDGRYIVAQPVQIATLIMVGVLYIDRDAKEYVDPRSGTGIERLNNMSLPRVVHWLLDPIRKPSLA